MSDDPDNVILLTLKSIDEKLDGIRKDISFLKERMIVLETHEAASRREVVSAEEAISLQGDRLDFIDSKLGRIMRRLNLIDETSVQSDTDAHTGEDTETSGGTPPPG